MWILTQKNLASVGILFVKKIVNMIIYLAVVCDEEAIPPFRVDSAVGTIDFLDRKEEDPERWNVFQKRLTYTCPVGFIIDRPDGDYSEQPDPIPEEQYSFEVSFFTS